jgi:hypothetical protein
MCEKFRQGPLMPGPPVGDPIGSTTTSTGKTTRITKILQTYTHAL